MVPANSKDCERKLGVGGEGGIRTLERACDPPHDFQSCTFNHSVTSPVILDHGVGEGVPGDAKNWRTQLCNQFELPLK